jgi:PAS domain S-box-containing protein
MSLEAGKVMNQRAGVPDDLFPALTQTIQQVGTILQLADGTIQACDSIAADLLGHTVEQLVGKTSRNQPWQTIHRNGASFVADDYPDVVAIRTGKPCLNVAIGFYRPSGDLVWLDVTATPLFQSGSPAPYAVIVTLRETSETQDFEQMRSTFDRFQVLVEHASEQIALLTEDCRYSYVNDAFCQKHGYTRDEMRSLHGYDVNVNGSLEEFQQLWKAAQQQPSIRLDVQHKTKLGEKFDLDITLKFFRFDGEAFLCGFGRDITERKQLLLALRQSEERLHLGIQVARIALVRFDYALNTVAISPEAAALYGISLDGLTSSHDRLYTVLDNPETAELLDIIQQALKSENLEEPLHEYCVTLKNGEVRWLNVRKQVFFDRSGDSPRPDYAIIAAMDITDRKRVELERNHLLEEAQAARAEAEAANRSKDEFVAVVAHELRSPLNSIAGWAKLLRIRKFDQEKTAKALDTIWRNTQTQIQLVEDLLDISRMIKGSLQLTIAPVNLAAVAEAAVNLISPQAQAKQVQVDLQLASVPKVSGDFNRLQQVVVNLLTNAIKFTPEQGRVEVCVESLEDQVQLCVRDTGKGISPEFLHQIFERFQQGQKNTGSKDGLGLGLAIVKNLVELHQGSITVESEGVGKGATFTIQLPSVDLPERQSESMPIAQRINPLSRVRILVVDDEPDMLSLIVFVLEEAGAEVRAVHSGFAALDCLDEFQPDILISDIAMPEGDGYDLIRQVRARLEDVPAIALTAYASATHEERSLQAGFQKHFTKPFESESLITAIVNLINLG